MRGRRITPGARGLRPWTCQGLCGPLRPSRSVEGAAVPVHGARHCAADAALAAPTQRAAWAAPQGCIGRGGLRGGGWLARPPPPRVPLSSPPKAGRKFVSVNPLGTEGAVAKSWLSASNIGRGGFQRRDPPHALLLRCPAVPTHAWPHLCSRAPTRGILTYGPLCQPHLLRVEPPTDPPPPRGINGRYRSTECPRHRHFPPLVQRFSNQMHVSPSWLGCSTSGGGGFGPGQRPWTPPPPGQCCRSPSQSTSPGG